MFRWTLQRCAGRYTVRHPVITTKQPYTTVDVQRQHVFRVHRRQVVAATPRSRVPGCLQGRQPSEAQPEKGFPGCMNSLPFGWKALHKIRSDCRAVDVTGRRGDDGLGSPVQLQE